MAKQWQDVLTIGTEVVYRKRRYEVAGHATAGDALLQVYLRQGGETITVSGREFERGWKS